MGAGQSGCKANYYKENEDDEDCIPVPVPCDVKKYRLTKSGTCRSIPEEGCPVNQYRSSKSENCKPIPTAPCGLNKYKTTETGKCMDIPQDCGDGKYLKNGKCVDLPKVCGDGQYLKDGDCVDLPTDCKQGEYKNSLDDCVPLPKLNPIDLVSNDRGKEIVDGLDQITGCPVHVTVKPSGTKPGDKGVPLRGGWCVANYNYVLPSGMLPKCRGGKAQRICYEPGKSESGDDYYLSIKGMDDTGKCTATNWKKINSADNTGLIDTECAKVIDLMVTDDTKLPQKVDGKSIGGVCLEGTDCHSGVCTSNLCVKGSLSVGADCIHNDRCSSSKCVANKCVAATTSTQGFSNYSGNLDTYDKTKPIDTLILVFVILMILFLLFRICKRLKVMK